MTTRAAIVELAGAVRKIQDAALFHRDFHAGNFLWHGASVVLTDLHKAKVVSRLSLKRKLWMISHLLHSLRFRWTGEHEVAFLDACFEGDSLSDGEKESYLQTIHRWMDRFQRRQWRSRTKRCLKQSTEFTVEKEGETTYYHRRDVPLGRLKEVIQGHRRIVEEEPPSVIEKLPSCCCFPGGEGEREDLCKTVFLPHPWGTGEGVFPKREGTQGLGCRERLKGPRDNRIETAGICKADEVSRSSRRVSYDGSPRDRTGNGSLSG